MTRPLLTLPIGFAPLVVDKVERLLEVLSAIREDPMLGHVFVLQGGTALNLFYDRPSRLSIDIGLMFVGAADVGGMRAMRPEVDARFREVVVALGYVVQGTNDEHSGQTYRVKYPGNHVKVDVSYLARIALLEPQERTCEFADPPIAFPVLQRPELAAGKIKALMERAAARDLYDLYRLSVQMPRLFDEPVARALAIRAICTADPFPAMKDPVEALERFNDPASEFIEPLFAMLRSGEAPKYEVMLKAVSRWLSVLSSLSVAETEFMRLLDERAEYRPELLLAEWPGVLEKASRDPVMAWKVRNLSERPPNGRT